MNGEFRALSLGSLAVILIALAAWAAFFGPDDDDGVPDVEAGSAEQIGNLDGPVVRNSLPFDLGGDDAYIGGELGLIDGCLVIIGDDHETVFPIVWPATTAWDAASEEVILPSGDRLEIGDPVEGGGGYPDLARLTWLDEAAQEHAATCPTDEWGEWALFNNHAGGARRG